MYQRSVAFIVLPALGLTLTCAAWADEDCPEVDGPQCDCFYEGVTDWDPSGELLQVAAASVGVEESCGEDHGQPYWMVLRGFESAADAEVAASFEAVFGSPVGRDQWCSETVTWWHQKAGSPYDQGYANIYIPAWELGSVTRLRQWYQGMELISERGRWIDSLELDYDDLRPGQNAPCPGAYQALEGWSDGDWHGAGDAHSQVVSAMTVVQDGDGDVIRVDLEIVEGNSYDSIRDDRLITDLELYLPVEDGLPLQVSDSHPDGRRLRGWGIDLDEDGDSRCDMDAITWETVEEEEEPEPRPDREPTIERMDDDTETFLKRLEIFAHAMHDTGVEIRVDDLLRDDLEDLVTGSWALSAERSKSDTIEVEIRWPAPLPYEVETLELVFGERAPSAVEAWVSDGERWTEVESLKGLEEQARVTLMMEPQEVSGVWLSVLPLDGKGTDIDHLWLNPPQVEETEVEEAREN